MAAHQRDVAAAHHHAALLNDEMVLVRQRLKAVPKDVLRNERLVVLDLSHNELSALPDALAALQQLCVLRGNSNRFAEFPPVLLRMASLVEIALARNRIESVPAALAALPSLQCVDLRGNPLSSVPALGRIELQHDPAPRAAVPQQRDAAPRAALHAQTEELDRSILLAGSSAVESSADLTAGLARAESGESKAAELGAAQAERAASSKSPAATGAAAGAPRAAAAPLPSPRAAGLLESGVRLPSFSVKNLYVHGDGSGSAGPDADEAEEGNGSDGSDTQTVSRAYSANDVVKRAPGPPHRGTFGMPPSRARVAPPPSDIEAEAQVAATPSEELLALRAHVAQQEADLTRLRTAAAATLRETPRTAAVPELGAAQAGGGVHAACVRQIAQLQDDAHAWKAMAVRANELCAMQSGQLESLQRAYVVALQQGKSAPNDEAVMKRKSSELVQLSVETSNIAKALDSIGAQLGASERRLPELAGLLSAHARLVAACNALGLLLPRVPVRESSGAADSSSAFTSLPDSESAFSVSRHAASRWERDSRFHSLQPMAMGSQESVPRPSFDVRRSSLSPSDLDALSHSYDAEGRNRTLQQSRGDFALESFTEPLRVERLTCSVATLRRPADCVPQLRNPSRFVRLDGSSRSSTRVRYFLAQDGYIRWGNVPDKMRQKFGVKYIESIAYGCASARLRKQFELPSAQGTCFLSLRFHERRLDLLAETPLEAFKWILCLQVMRDEVVALLAGGAAAAESAASLRQLLQSSTSVPGPLRQRWSIGRLLLRCLYLTLDERARADKVSVGQRFRTALQLARLARAMPPSSRGDAPAKPSALRPSQLARPVARAASLSSGGGLADRRVGASAPEPTKPVQRQRLSGAPSLQVLRMPVGSGAEPRPPPSVGRRSSGQSDPVEVRRAKTPQPSSLAGDPAVLAARPRSNSAGPTGAAGTAAAARVGSREFANRNELAVIARADANPSPMSQYSSRSTSPGISDFALRGASPLLDALRMATSLTGGEQATIAESVAAMSSQVEPPPFHRNVERLVAATTRAGNLFIKYPFGGGKPKMRCFSLHAEQRGRETICWGEPERSLNSSMKISSVRFLVFGAKTKTFKSRKGDEDLRVWPWRCFSVVTNRRTLDVQASTDEQAQAWFLAIQALVVRSHEDRHLPLERNMLTRAQLNYARAKLKIVAQTSIQGRPWVQNLVDAIHRKANRVAFESALRNAGSTTSLPRNASVAGGLLLATPSQSILRQGGSTSPLPLPLPRGESTGNVGRAAVAAADAAAASSQSSAQAARRPGNGAALASAGDAGARQH